MNWKVYSPPCAAITSCSTRGACSPVGCSHRLEYASWGQATICQIRPIAHVRCAVYSVLLSRVCVANVSCMQRARSHPSHRPHRPHRDTSRRVATPREFFVRRPEGCATNTTGWPSPRREHTAKRARTWHRFAECSLRLSPRPIVVRDPFNGVALRKRRFEAARSPKGSDATTPVSNRFSRKKIEKLFHALFTRCCRNQFSGVGIRVLDTVTL